jgi:hypothetical protein
MRPVVLSGEKSREAKLARLGEMVGEMSRNCVTEQFPHKFVRGRQERRADQTAAGV